MLLPKIGYFGKQVVRMIIIGMGFNFIINRTTIIVRLVTHGGIAPIYKWVDGYIAQRSFYSSEKTVI